LYLNYKFLLSLLYKIIKDLLSQFWEKFLVVCICLAQPHLIVKVFCPTCRTYTKYVFWKISTLLYQNKRNVYWFATAQARLVNIRIHGSHLLVSVKSHLQYFCHTLSDLLEVSYILSSSAYPNVQVVLTAYSLDYL